MLKRICCLLILCFGTAGFAGNGNMFSVLDESYEPYVHSIGYSKLKQERDHQKKLSVKKDRDLKKEKSLPSRESKFCVEASKQWEHRKLLRIDSRLKDERRGENKYFITEVHKAFNNFEQIVDVGKGVVDQSVSVLKILNENLANIDNRKALNFFKKLCLSLPKSTTEQPCLRERGLEIHQMLYGFFNCHSCTKDEPCMYCGVKKNDLFQEAMRYVRSFPVSIQQVWIKEFTEANAPLSDASVSCLKGILERLVISFDEKILNKQKETEQETTMHCLYNYVTNPFLTPQQKKDWLSIEFFGWQPLGVFQKRIEPGFSVNRQLAGLATLMQVYTAWVDESYIGQTVRRLFAQQKKHTDISLELVIKELSNPPGDLSKEVRDASHILANSRWAKELINDWLDYI